MAKSDDTDYSVSLDLSFMFASLGVRLLRYLSYMPYSWVARLGQWLGFLLYQIPSKRRAIVQANLRYCFPHWNQSQQQKIARLHFCHAIRSYLERSIQWFAPLEKMMQLVKLESQIDLAEQDMPPTIFLGFHFVALEAATVFLSHILKRPCLTLYSPMSNRVLDSVARQQRLRFARDFGSELIPRSHSMRAIIRALQQKKPVMLAADLDHGIKNSAFIPFFSRSACTLTIISQLARLTGARIVPVSSKVLADYRGYQVDVFAALENFPSDDVLHDTTRLNQYLEQLILKMPEQYYWIHKRFKTRPEGEQYIY